MHSTPLRQPTFYSDLWFYSISANTWTNVTTTGAVPGVLGASAMVHYGQALYLFGGINGFFVTNNNLWKFNITSSTWSLLTVGGTPPPAMENHDMVISLLGRIYLGFGETFNASTTDQNITQGVWTVDITQSSPSWSQVTLNTPSPAPSLRNYLGLVIILNNLIIFAGDQEGGNSICGAPFPQNPGNQTWVLTLSNTPPSPAWYQYNASLTDPKWNTLSFPYGLKRHRSVVASTPGDLPDYVMYSVGGYSWNGASTNCTTNPAQLWNTNLIGVPVSVVFQGAF